MSAGPQLFRVNPESRKSERIEEVDFASLGLRERRDIQEWVAAYPGILGDDLLIIGKEFSGFDRTSERLDLLAVDTDGKLVIIELKRDDSGTDAHWQAIKYASYLNRASTEQIVAMLAGHDRVSESDAANRLLQHLNSDDLDALNNDQRIILASHRFAPEVTSAALWLNEQAGKALMTCVRLTPHQDSDTLYVQANPIIPVPVIEDYVIGVGDSPNGTGHVVRGSGSLKQTFDANKNDEITRFLKTAAKDATAGLSHELIPDKQSRWAGADSSFRYYHVWYARQPWSNWGMSYGIHLSCGSEGEGSESMWIAEVGFSYRKRSDTANLSEREIEDLRARIEKSRVYDNQTTKGGTVIEITVSQDSEILDAEFSSKLAGTLRRFIERITPVVDDFEAARNQEDA